MVLVWWCTATKAVKRLIKAAVVCVGCATVLYCKGYQNGDFQPIFNAPAELVSGDSTGGAQSGVDAGALGVLSGTAIYFAANHVGPALDDVVISSLEDPEVNVDKKYFIRRLNYGYSALKLGLIMAIAKGACICMDQSKTDIERIGLVCTTGVVMAPLMASLCKTAFK